MARRGVEVLLGRGAARRYLLAVAFLTPLLTTRLVGFAPLTHNPYELPKAVLLWVLAFAALLSWAVTIAREGGPIRLTWWFAATGVYVGWTALAAVLSRAPATSLLGSHARLDGLLTTLAYGAVAFVGVQVFSSAGDLRTLARVIVASGLLVSAYAMVQATGFDPAFYYSVGVEFTAGRVFSTLGNPVFLGGFLVIVLPVAALLALAEDDGRWRAAAWATVVLAVIAVLATASRAAWAVALVDGVLVVAVVVRKRLRPGREGVFAAAAALVGAVVYTLRSLASSDPALNVAKRAGSLFSAPSDSSLERLLIARAAIRSATARPLFGYGPDRFVVAFRGFRSPEHVRNFPQGNYVDSAHSVPLQVASTAGIVAALAWLAAAFGPLVTSARTAFTPGGDRSRVLFSSMWIAAVGGVAYMATGISVVPVASTLWLLLAVLAASTARVRVTPPGRPASVVAAVVACVLLAAAVGYGGVLLVADNRYMLARRSLQGDAPGDPVDAVRRASAIDPLEVLYRKDLALQLLSGGSLDEQLGALDAALALEPDDVHLMALKAQLLSSTGRYADATRIIQRAVRLAPTDPLVRGAESALVSQP